MRAHHPELPGGGDRRSPSSAGRTTAPTPPASSTAEFYVPLKPFGTWPPGVDKATLTQQMSEALSAPFPGVEFNFSQYIEDNVEEAASGVKGENSVKLYGNDLAALEKTAAPDQGGHGRRCRAWPTSPSSTPSGSPRSISTSTEPAPPATAWRRATSTPRSRRRSAASAAGDLYEHGSDRNFPIIVRLAPRVPRQPRRHPPHHDRGRRPALEAGSSPSRSPMSPRSTLVSGFSFIYRENQERYIPDQIQRARARSGQRRAEAQRKIAAQVRLPPGTRLEWVGEFGELQEPRWRAWSSSCPSASS